VKGAATLYTREYFEHVKAHLNPGCDFPFSASNQMQSVNGLRDHTSLLDRPFA
jgi:hypothetical protein